MLDSIDLEEWRYHPYTKKFIKKLEEELKELGKPLPLHSTIDENAMYAIYQKGSYEMLSNILNILRGNDE